MGLEDRTAADHLDLGSANFLTTCVFCPLVCASQRAAIEEVADGEIVCVSVVVTYANLASDTQLLPEVILDVLNLGSAVDRNLLCRDLLTYLRDAACSVDTSNVYELTTILINDEAES